MGGVETQLGADSQLIRIEGDDAQTFDLDVGQGMTGMDLWAKMSLTKANGSHRLAYYTGWSYPRNGGSRQNPGPGRVVCI